jgi:hypothetical protein
MKLKHLFLFLILSLSQSVYSNQRITGLIVDKSTGEELPYVTVSLLKSDSTLISTVVSRHSDQYQYVNGTFMMDSPGKGNYILRCSLLGYVTTYKKIEINEPKRISEIEIPTISMSIDSKLLRGVTINGTKIKMVMKGDTIVYNADAFRLAEGSMLYALVSQLPGAELKSDGRIYVNGRYVDNLIVNGRDFFRGDPKVALENLPAYTVDRIKVYEQEGDLSKLMKQKIKEDLSYVMDVRLKKEYSVGWIVNAEDANGSKDRYLFRLFALRFNTLSRLVFFGNINNVNDKQRPESNGEWQPADIPDGLLATKTAGFSYNIEGKKHNFKFNTDNTVTHDNADNKTWTSTQTFITGGDSYRRSYNFLNQNRTAVSSDSYLSCQINKMLFRGGVKLGYEKKNVSSSYLSAIFTDNPLGSYEVLDSIFSGNNSSALRHITLDRLKQTGNYSEKTTNLVVNFGDNINIKGDLLSLKGSVDYRNNHKDELSIYELDYIKNGGTGDYRQNYRPYSNNTLKLHFDSRYEYNIGDSWNNIISASYTFDYRRSQEDNPLYRLDWLGDSILPSAYNYMSRTMDSENSYNYIENEYQHRLNMTFRYLLYLHKKGHSIEYTFDLPLRWIKRNLNYYRTDNYDIVKDKLFIEPYVHIGYNVFTRKCYQLIIMNASISSDIPNMVDMVDYKDNSNPLFVINGNPYLKMVHNYNLHIGYSNNMNANQEHYSVGFDFHAVNNAVAYGYVFDKQTGITTTKPESVNGNWTLNLTSGYGRTLGKKVTFDNKLNGGYVHSVDMVGVTGENGSIKSIVHNMNLGDNMKLDYHLNSKIQIGMKLQGRYNHVTSARKDFVTINAGDFSYGFSSIIELPWKMQLASDMTQYSHRGYSNKAMNTDELVWNIQLSKNFFKGKLVARIDAYDILGKLSNYRYELNSQGRTECYTNVIPRYVMLHLSYRFNKQPKKK